MLHIKYTHKVVICSSVTAYTFRAFFIAITFPVLGHKENELSVACTVAINYNVRGRYLHLPEVPHSRQVTMSKKSWSVENLQGAIQAIKEKKLSIRAASCAYGVPRSTLHDYLVGRVEIGCPDSILTTAEEQCLVSYALHMAEIDR